MARNKEALVLLLDVGPTMHHLLPEVEKICSLIIQKKLVYSKYDEVGIVIFGTKETENDLTLEVGGYEHVHVLQNIRVVDSDLGEALHELPKGNVPGDFLDAIVVGMDLLIKKYAQTNKGKKRLCLITNGLSPVKDPSEGSKEDQANTIAEQMTSHGMRLECVVVRDNAVDGLNETILEENNSILNLFPQKTSAKTLYVESTTSLLGALRTRSISPVTIFRGDLEVSPELKIKVWVYKKTFEEKFPTLKKYSDKAPSTDRFATHEVKVDYEYKSAEDESKVVPPEQRIKGYRYGPQVVPISSDEWDTVKFKPEKGIKLLGFTNVSNILRHHYMKDVNIVIAEPNDNDANVTVSAFARAMKKLEKVAIVRCVWRQGQANVVIGILTPNLAKDDHVRDSFYFNIIPFAEDIREFQFPSFDSLPLSMLPNDQQQEAANNFVESLDLATSDKEEVLRPEFTPNPILERFYNYLELKSKRPDASVPPLDKALKRITEPDLELFMQKKSEIDSFRRQFEVKERPKKQSKRLRERPSASDDEKDSRLRLNEDVHALIENGVKVEEIGDLMPVQDFEAMISRRDNPAWVSRAIKGMSNKIFDLVENSYEGDNFPKALELLDVLRKGCIVEQEPKQFNDFLRHLCQFCTEDQHDLKSFCVILASREITLISKTEAIDSDVEDAEAKSFLIKTEPKDESTAGVYRTTIRRSLGSALAMFLFVG